MTQTSPKPTPENSTNSQEDAVENHVSQVSTTAQPTVVTESKLQPDVVVKHKPIARRRSRGLSLRNKATALAIALGTLPLLAIGAGNYYFFAKELRQDTIGTQESLTVALGDQISRFMFERYGDIQILSNLRAFTDPRITQITSEQKEAQLKRFSDVYGFYDSIAVFDLNGNVIAKTGGELGRNSQGQVTNNIKDRDHFQAVLKTNRPVISQPSISKTTGKASIFFAAPIKDIATGQTISIVRTRMPVEVLEKLLKTEEIRLAEGIKNAVEAEYHLVDASGKFFLAKETEQVGQDARTDFASFAQMQAKEQVTSAIDIGRIDNAEQLVSYAPIKPLQGMPSQNWSILLAEDTATAFAAQRQLLLTLLLGTGVTALLVGAIAAYLANRATRPIVKAASTVEKLGQGQLDSRIRVSGDDELAILGENINSMASKLQTLLAQQAQEAERIRLVKDITLRLGQYPQVQEIFNVAVAEIRTALNCDRVVVYSFDTNWKGTVIAEAVAEGFPKALGAKIDDPCFAKGYVERYRSGRVQATNDIYNAGLTECHLKQLAQFDVQANLVAPIIQGGQLLGLLIAHQCSAPRTWQQGEIDLFAQLATQVGYALDRAKLLEQQKAAKELLQRRALELLMEVDPISHGDLTIRASVTEDEIGTIADSYNSTVNSLRKIVNTVQTAATQVATTTTTNETAVSELSDEALRQAQEINAAVARIQQMSASIQAVADKAATAQAAVQQANATVAAGDTAMNRTVDGITSIQETVSQTAAKVKRLDESSQKISQVVNLIARFAEQTNLLALNAAIEAARAGEEGRGFAVVADEVGVLARQSTEATAEIEKLVAEIQQETQEVAAAMTSGTEQVSVGTRLVDETRSSLQNITEISTQISNLVQEIAAAAVTQSQASNEVTQTMTNVAAIADKTSTEANTVSTTFKQLQTLAQELQTSVAQFKVS